MEAVLSASADHSLRLHKIRKAGGAAGGVELSGHRADVTTCKGMGSTGRAVSASTDDELIVWDLALAAPVVRAKGMCGEGVSTVGYDEASQGICIGRRGGVGERERRGSVLGGSQQPPGPAGPSLKSVLFSSPPLGLPLSKCPASRLSLARPAPTHWHPYHSISPRVGVAVVDATTLDLTASLPCSAELYGVAFCGRGGRTVAAACGDSRLRVWDLRSPPDRPAGAMQGSSRGAARCLHADEEGAWVACGGADGYVRLFDLRMAGAGPFASARAHAGDVVNCVRFERAHGFLVSGGDDCTVVVQRLPTLDRLGAIANRVGVLGVDTDFSTLAVAGEDLVVKLYDFNIDETNWLDVESLGIVSRAMEARRHRSEAAAREGAGHANVRASVPMGPGMGTNLHR